MHRIDTVRMALQAIRTNRLRSSLTLVGIVLGFACGALSKLMLRSRLVAGELRNLSILAILMVCYLLAEEQALLAGTGQRLLGKPHQRLQKAGVNRIISVKTSSRPSSIAEHSSHFAVSPISP